jgi:hypothetical protein
LSFCNCTIQFFFVKLIINVMNSYPTSRFVQQRYTKTSGKNSLEANNTQRVSDVGWIKILGQPKPA